MCSNCSRFGLITEITEIFKVRCRSILNFTMRIMNTERIDTKCDLTEKTFEVPDWNIKAEVEVGNTKVEKSSNELVPVAIESKDIGNLVYVIRGKQVMIDSDLAVLYQVETKNLNKAASRNSDRFPEDFRFKLTKEEFDGLRFQSGTSNQEQGGRGGRRYYPYAYT